MSNTETGGPAFPGWHTVSDRLFHDEGMTLRDHFAGLAMQGILASNEKELDYESRAAFSYKQADAMLKARSAKTG